MGTIKVETDGTRARIIVRPIPGPIAAHLPDEYTGEWRDGESEEEAVLLAIQAYCGELWPHILTVVTTVATVVASLAWADFCEEQGVSLSGQDILEAFAEQFDTPPAEFLVWAFEGLANWSETGKVFGHDSVSAKAMHEYAMISAGTGAGSYEFPWSDKVPIRDAATPMWPEWYGNAEQH